MAHEVGFVVDVDQHVGKVGFGQPAADQLAERGFRGPGRLLIVLIATPPGPGELEAAPPCVDGDGGIGGEPGFDCFRHRFQLAVEACDELGRVGRQSEGGVVVQAFGRPCRLRDEVVVEVGPPARPLDGDVAALDALVERGQQGRFAMQPGDRPFLAGARCRPQDVAPPSRRQEAQRRVDAQLAAPVPVGLAQVLDRQAQFRAWRKAQRCSVQQSWRILARGGVPAPDKAEMRARVALAQSPAPLDQQADLLARVARMSSPKRKAFAAALAG